ncbi:MAG: hypothetical protein M3069_31885 [Chloroflexota bacterium]|nr:hypothetical protein [Chloroflexota bacterium]
MSGEGSQKRCCRCGEVKQLNEFTFKNRATGRLHAFCRTCHKAWNRSHYERNRATYIANAKRRGPVYHAENLRRLVAYLWLHPCVDCGERDPIVLEFDHRDRSTKRATVSNLMRYSAWPQIDAEITKCDVRCANCHRKRTARQIGWGKIALALHDLDR